MEHKSQNKYGKESSQNFANTHVSIHKRYHKILQFHQKTPQLRNFNFYTFHLQLLDIHVLLSDIRHQIKIVKAESS